MSPKDQVAMVLQAIRVPVLAHPFTTNDPEAMIVELKKAGLVGIEAYYDGYTADKVNQLVDLANKHNVIATGGSDYHGLGLSNETMLGGVEVPIKAAEQLIALAEQRGRELKQ